MVDLWRGLSGDVGLCWRRPRKCNLVMRRVGLVYEGEAACSDVGLTVIYSYNSVGVSIFLYIFSKPYFAHVYLV